MNQKTRKILIPYDFSELSDYAVKHAVQIAKITESSLVFLHVIDDLSREHDALSKLEQVANGVIAKYGVQIECKIRPGRVSTAIKTFAETIEAYLIVMKTQKPKGKEKYLGTRCVRVMAGSRHRPNI